MGKVKPTTKSVKPEDSCKQCDDVGYYNMRIEDNKMKCCECSCNPILRRKRVKARQLQIMLKGTYHTYSGEEKDGND